MGIYTLKKVKERKSEGKSERRCLARESGEVRACSGEIGINRNKEKGNVGKGFHSINQSNELLFW